MKPSRAEPSRAEPSRAEPLRVWLEHVAQAAIDWLDELDADAEDREDDELGDHG